MLTEILMFLFVMGSLAGVIMLGVIFYSAYATPEKALMVHIDRYGEAEIEAMIIMPIILLCAVGGAVLGSLTLWGALR